MHAHAYITQTEWKYKENKKTKFKNLDFEMEKQNIKNSKIVFLYLSSRALQRESSHWS